MISKTEKCLKRLTKIKKRIDVFPKSGINCAIKKITRGYFQQVYKQTRKFR